MKANTMSAVCTSNGKVQHMHGLYEPEIYHTIGFIKDGIHYTVYDSGKAITNGIKPVKNLDMQFYSS